MVGDIFLGRYQTLGFLGRGSMGRVFLARRLQPPEGHVVIKVMNDTIAKDPKFRQLFLREMQFMARFRHANAVQLLDASLTDPHGPCIVMEYIPGVTLDRLLLKSHRVSVQRTVGLLAPLCYALQAAHQQSLIHRDLKPANLMVLDPDSSRESIKVMDFGLASLGAKPHIPLEKLVGDGPDVAVGTPAYMAPEQIRGDGLDHRGDIYSLGVILYEMLTGKLPFNYTDPYRVMDAHVAEQPPAFKTLGATHCPPAVEGVVRMMLAKYPIERPQTAQEAAERFAQAAGMKLPPPPEPLTAASPLPALVAETDTEDGTITPNRANGLGLVRELDAWMPERIAVVKLRGFVEDAGGRVLSSEPGLVRVRLRDGMAVPTSASGAKPGWLAWLGRLSDSHFGAPLPKLRDPIEIELHMEKRGGATSNQLHLIVRFHPPEGRQLMDPHEWMAACRQVFNDLSAYLMAGR